MAEKRRREPSGANGQPVTLSSLVRDVLLYQRSRLLVCRTLGISTLITPDSLKKATPSRIVSLVAKWEKDEKFLAQNLSALVRSTPLLPATIKFNIHKISRVEITSGGVITFHGKNKATDAVLAAITKPQRPVAYMCWVATTIVDRLFYCMVDFMGSTRVEDADARLATDKAAIDTIADEFVQVLAGISTWDRPPEEIVALPFARTLHVKPR